MDAALIALIPAYTAAVVLACRHYWAHRCAECSYRSRTTHTPGRHRPDRVALPARPTPAILPALPAGTDPDATTPTLPTRPRPHPSPFSHAGEHTQTRSAT